MVDPPKILIVDDEPRMCDSLKALLDPHGYEIKVSHSADEAFERLDGEGFDLVLMDVCMEGIDGFEAMDRMTSRQKDFVYLIMTGYASAESAATAFRKGAYDYLVKPFDPKVLVSTVKHALSHKADKIALRESEERYRNLFQNVPSVAVQGYAPDGTTRFWNSASERLYGFSAAEAVGRNLVDLIIPPEMRAHVEQAIRQMADTGQAIPGAELSLMRKDGSRVPVFSSHAIVQVTGRPPELFCIDIDLAERKRSEDALRESEERYRRITENAKDMIYRMSLPEGRYEYVSPASIELTGYTPEEFYETPGLIRKVIHPSWADYLEENWKKLASGFLPPFYEYQVVHKSGEVKWLHQRNVMVRDIGGNPSAIEAIVSDITDRKRAEEERLLLEQHLQQAQKAESLGRMAGAVAHHFNNLLAVVLGNLELAQNLLLQGKHPAENLGSAIKAAHRASDISALMQAYLGQTTGAQELLDLSEICRVTLSLLRAGMPKRILLESNLISPGPVIRGNSIQIQQVLTNLVTNAWEAMGCGVGAIELSVKTVSASEIPAGIRFPVDWQAQDNLYACLEVSDTGCGITEKDIVKIFDPFFSSKFIGRGLGLPVVLGTLRTHCGCVTVESKPGRGSTLRVFLPVSLDEIARPMEKAAGPVPAQQNTTVLIVEDEPSVRKMAREMLEYLGHTVIEAKDGVEAVEIFEQHREVIRLVLCDLTMPRMSGWETMAHLRKIAPEIPIILASGYDEGYAISNTHPEKPDHFLHKPYTINDLNSAVHLILT